jgi:hypothetical protein
MSGLLKVKKLLHQGNAEFVIGEPDNPVQPHYHLFGLVASRASGERSVPRFR